MSSAVVSTSAALGRPFVFDDDADPEVCALITAHQHEHAAVQESAVVRVFQSTLKNQRSKIPLAPASQLEIRPAPEMVPSGIPSLDALTGGLPRGCVTEIWASLPPDAPLCSWRRWLPPLAGENSAHSSMPATLSTLTQPPMLEWIWIAFSGCDVATILRNHAQDKKGAPFLARLWREKWGFPRSLHLISVAPIRGHPSTGWSNSCAPPICCSKAEVLA